MAKQLNRLPKWGPDPRNRPQWEAYYSTADELLFGGKPFGGKSFLLLLIARFEHRNSLIIRQSLTELKDTLIPQSLEFYGPREDYNASDYLWQVDGRRIRFAYGETIADIRRRKGGSFDLIGFDEASEMVRGVFEEISPWNRTTIRGQRVRKILTSNPGGHGEEWLMEYWAPWLDEKYSNPAKPGELRWFIGTKEVAKGTEFSTSRTYIPSSWKENPYTPADYEKTLHGLPGDLKEQLLHGKWGLQSRDDRWQAIPTEWVKLAMDRWEERNVVAYDAVGADIAMGGNDKTVFCGRVEHWFAKLQKYPGVETPDGNIAAGLLHRFIIGSPIVAIDWIGFGSSCYDAAKEWCNAVPFVASQGSNNKDKNGQLGFVNLRSEVWWKFREALDPESGDNVSLPPDRELLADLTAPRYEYLRARGGVIRIEEKKSIIRRLGRSPDSADAVIICWHGGSGMCTAGIEVGGKTIEESGGNGYSPWGTGDGKYSVW